MRAAEARVVEGKGEGRREAVAMVAVAMAAEEWVAEATVVVA